MFTIFGAEKGGASRMWKKCKLRCRKNPASLSLRLQPGCCQKKPKSRGTRKIVSRHQSPLDLDVPQHTPSEARSAEVMAVDSQSKGHGLNSHPSCCWVWPWASRSRTPASVSKRYSLVLVEGQWCSDTRKVTGAMVLHWPCDNRLCGLYHLRVHRPYTKMSSHAYGPIDYMAPMQLVKHVSQLLCQTKQ